MLDIKFIDIPEGTFLMGAISNDGHPLDKETPQVSLFVEEFKISETTITNAQFKEFIDATDYLTTAEKNKGSYVFHLLLDQETKEKSRKVSNLPWWYYVEGACWKHPFGPNSTIEEIMDHPVVHVSWFDAMAFCEWSKTRLPSEAEWEYAARAGSTYKWPWGPDFIKDGKFLANIWQGDFPNINTMEDGYLGTAPAKSFEANDFGIYNVIGNVWEWCANPRYVDLDSFKKFNYKLTPPVNLDNIDNNTEFSMRGGSFLCHDSYCNRYRLGARNGNTASSTTSNCGFRVCKLSLIHI